MGTVSQLSSHQQQGSTEEARAPRAAVGGEADWWGYLPRWHARQLLAPWVVGTRCGVEAQAVVSQHRVCCRPALSLRLSDGTDGCGDDSPDRVLRMLQSQWISATSSLTRRSRWCSQFCSNLRCSVHVCME